MPSAFAADSQYLPESKVQDVMHTDRGMGASVNVQTFQAGLGSGVVNQQRGQEAQDMLPVDFMGL